MSIIDDGLLESFTTGIVISFERRIRFEDCILTTIMIAVTSCLNGLVNIILLILSEHNLKIYKIINNLYVSNQIPWNAIGRCFVDFPRTKQLHLDWFVRPHCGRFYVGFFSHHYRGICCCSV